MTCLECTDQGRNDGRNRIGRPEAVAETVFDELIGSEMPQNTRQVLVVAYVIEWSKRQSVWMKRQSNSTTGGTNHNALMKKSSVARPIFQPRLMSSVIKPFIQTALRRNLKRVPTLDSVMCRAISSMVSVATLFLSRTWQSDSTTRAWKLDQAFETSALAREDLASKAYVFARLTMSVSRCSWTLL